MVKKKIEPEKTKKIEPNKTDIQSVFSFLDKINSNYSAFNSKKVSISVIDTGSPAINNAIGINGIPRGRVTHIYGPQGSGKSFLSMLASKEALEEDLNSYVVWFDAEHSFNFEWAEKMGIWSKDPTKNRMMVIPGSDGVEIFESIYGKIKKERFASKKMAPGILDRIMEGALNCPLIVIDSVASIITPKEKAAPVGSVTVSALAGFITAELRRISENIEKANVALLLINQVRQNMDPYGDTYHHPGGENLKHQISLNLYCERQNSIDGLILAEDSNRDTLLGQKVKVVVKKSRFSPTPRSAITTLLFSEGAGYDKIGIVDVEIEIIALATKLGLLQRGGSWFTLPNGEKFQGEIKVQEQLRNNPEMLQQLINGIKNHKSSIQVKGGIVEVEERIDGYENTDDKTNNEEE